MHLRNANLSWSVYSPPTPIELCNTLMAPYVSIVKYHRCSAVYLACPFSNAALLCVVFSRDLLSATVPSEVCFSEPHCMTTIANLCLIWVVFNSHIINHSIIYIVLLPIHRLVLLLRSFHPLSPFQFLSRSITWGQDYKLFLSMSRCSTRNLCTEMT